MKLEEAIKILSQWEKGTDPLYLPTLPDALSLGIVALKWRCLMERDYGSWCGPLLPGETKD